MAGADVEMAANATAPGVNLEMLRQMQWEILVEFKNGMWWMMPHELSDPIVEQRRRVATEVSFIWDWHGTRRGSYQPNRAETDINRYIIDFTARQQRNIDNNRTRNVAMVISSGDGAAPACQMLRQMQWKILVGVKGDM